MTSDERDFLRQMTLVLDKPGVADAYAALNAEAKRLRLEAEQYLKACQSRVKKAVAKK